MDHRAKFYHGKRLIASTYPSADIERETRGFQDDDEAHTDPERYQEDEKNNTENQIKRPLHNPSPCSDTDSTDFNEWYTAQEIYMGIVFGCFVEIADISVGDTIYLAVFEEDFFELVRKIMSEDDHFIDILSFNNICMGSYGPEILKVAFLAKWCEISDDREMVLIHERFFQMGLTVVHDEEYLFLPKPSVHKSIHAYGAYDDTLEYYPQHSKDEGIDEDQTRDQDGLIRESIREIEESYHDKESDKDRLDDCKNFFDDAHNPLNGIELLKSEDHTDDGVARCRESNEIGEIDRTIGELDTRYQICCDTYLTGHEKCSYDDEEFERYTDKSEKELMSAHKNSIDEIFDFSNLDMVG